MKYNYKKTLGFLITAILLLGLSCNVYAYNYLGGKLQSGIYNIKYYVSTGSKPATDYASLISSAWSSWKSATGSITCLKQSSNKSSVVDFYADRVTSGNEADWTSWTLNYNPNSNGDWAFSYVYINRKWFDKQSSTVNKGCIAHEIGHVLGLNENNTNKRSIMCQSSYGRTVETPQKIDADAINNLY